MQTLEIAAKEVLMHLGRALSQVNLYSINHPAVKKIIAECCQILSESLNSDIFEEIVFSLDHDTLLVNGRRIGSIKDQSGSIRMFFLRYNLHSISFLRGLEEEEMMGLLKVLKENIKDLKDFNLDQYLGEKQIRHIRANEAFYTKVEKEEDNVVEETGGAPDAAAATGSPIAAKDSPAAKEIPANKETESLKAILGRLLDKSGEEGSSGEAGDLLEAGYEECKIELNRLVNEATKALLAEIARLENELKRLQGILSKTLSGFATLDRDGNILSVDAITEELLGLPQKDLAGKPIFDQAEPATHHLVTARELGQMPSKPTSPSINIRSSPDLAQAIGISGSLLYNESTRIVGLLMTPAENAKIKEYERLKTKMLSTIVATMAEPLELLEKGVERFEAETAGHLAPEQRQLLTHIITVQDRIRYIAKELREYSQIASAQLKVFKVNSSIYSIVHDATEGILEWAKSKKISIDIKQERGLPDVQCDPKRSVEALRHLLANAIKNSKEERSIEVSVTQGKEAQEGFILVVVKDQGQGIPSSEVGSIQEEFSQSSTPPFEEKGLGLGITLVKSLIELQKGAFSIESAPGQGATASFTLPIFIAPPGYTPPEKVEKVIKKTWWQKLLNFFGIKY
ncbi:MAG: ATP-binding protein [Elusimicrobiota bacterium]